MIRNIFSDQNIFRHVSEFVLDNLTTDFRVKALKVWNIYIEFPKIGQLNGVFIYPVV